MPPPQPAMIYTNRNKGALSDCSCFPAGTDVKALHMSWSGRGPDGRRGYHHGNLREALIQAALDLIAAQRLYCRPRSPASPRSCVLLLSRNRVLLPGEPIGLARKIHQA